MAEADVKTEMSTLLVLPIDLRNRILAEADIDKRQMKPEILVLLDEALKARERRRG